MWATAPRLSKRRWATGATRSVVPGANGAGVVHRRGMATALPRAHGPGRPRQVGCPSGHPRMSPGLAPCREPSHSPSFGLLEGGRGCRTMARAPRARGRHGSCRHAPPRTVDSGRSSLPRYATFAAGCARGASLAGSYRRRALAIANSTPINWVATATSACGLRREPWPEPWGVRSAPETPDNS
jgi:hypothetical protein